jgi:hypothetical protein
MSQITIHIHSELAERLLADGVEGARAVAALSRQAISVVQSCGRRIAYAPVVVPNVGSCAMSAHGGARGVVVEIDRLGTAIPGRGVVRDTQPRWDSGTGQVGRVKNSRR